MRPVYLNIGCGDWKLPGFLNIDREPGADLRLDVTLGLPFRTGSVAGIYSEHFLEHLAQTDGAAFLRECRRVLRPRGVLRIATPDLDGIVRAYGSAEWCDPEWKRHGYDWMANRCEMLNLALREWGHRWVYNEEELVRLARLAGLTPRGRCAPGESDEPAFRGLEHRGGAHLIMEFVKDREPDERPAPLVSLLIPAYKPRYFRAALESALAQTYPSIEVVVSDDCPSGEIGAIVAEYAGDPRLVYSRNAPALGGPANHVRCLELSRGDYIKFLNDDDLLHPSCVERLVAILQRLPDVTLVTSHRQIIDAEGRPQPDDDATARPVAEDSVIDGVSAANAMLALPLNFVGEPSTVMFRRRDVADIQPTLWSFAGRRCVANGDVTLWLNLLGKGDLAYLVDTLSSFRRHEDQEQRQPGYVERAMQAWEHLRFDAGRLGFLRPQGPWRLLTRPLAPAAGAARGSGWLERLAAAIREIQASMARGDAGTADALAARTLDMMDRMPATVLGGTAAAERLEKTRRALQAVRDTIARDRGKPGLVLPPRAPAPVPATASPEPPCPSPAAAGEVPAAAGGTPVAVPSPAPAASAAAHAVGDASAPRVSIVVRTYDNRERLERCLSALAEHMPAGLAEVIVVDDGSTDGTADLLRRAEAAGRLRAVIAPEHVGRARALNLGARLARGRFLVLLHDDVVPHGGWLDALLAVMESDPGVGAAGAKLLVPGTRRIQHAGLAFGPTRTPYHIYEGWNADHPAVNRLRSFRAVSGACLALRREQFLALEGLDEGYPGGYEDVDLCLRLGKAGARVVYVPGAVLDHDAHEPAPADPSHADDTRVSTRRLIERWGHALPADGPCHHADDGLELIMASGGVHFVTRPGRVFTSIVMVTYNSGLDLTDCLRTLYDFGNTGEPVELVVVDNASTDRTRDVLRMLLEQSPGVTVILNDDNVGFARAVNQGIRASSGRWVVLLNPDTRLTPDWLAGLRAHAGPGVGAVGPVSNAAIGDQEIRRYLPGWDGQADDATAALLRERWAGRSVETKSLMFFCTLLPRAVIEAVGPLDEDFFLNQEDLEYCLRLRLAGHRLVVAPDVFVYHLGGGSKLSLAAPAQLQLQVQSMQVLYRKLEERFGKGRVPPLEELWGPGVCGAAQAAGAAG